MKALKGGHEEIAHVLLNLGINVKLANLHGDTALHWAVNPISFAPIWSSNITTCIFYI
jgi:ankyrin repeat protein